MKTIHLGYLHMEGWERVQGLFSEWMYKDPEYKTEIAHTSPHEVVLDPNTKYTLEIDYPLSNPFIGEFTTGPDGMTRLDLVERIVETYKAIYQEEDEGVGHPTENIPGMLNRRTSDGPYGIWGHCLGDLMLHTAEIDDNNVITLGVDS